MAKKKPSFYAVAQGRRAGIFHSWPECEAQVKGFKGAIYQGFPTLGEAHDYIRQRTGNHEVIESLKGNPASVKKDEHTGSSSIIGQMPINGNDSGALKKGSPSKSANQLEDTVSSPMPVWTCIATARTSSKVKSQGLKRSAASEANSSHSIKAPKLVSKELAESANLNTEQGRERIRVIKVYTDGACPDNGSQHGREARAGWGVYWPESQDPNSDLFGKNEYARLPGEQQTNNRAELMGLIRAIELCPDTEAQLEIYTDSRYSIDTIDKWQRAWRENGWKKANGQVPSNKDLIRRLERAMRSRRLRPILIWVKGHNKDKGNVEADKLAVMGANLPMIEKHLWTNVEPSDSEEDSKDETEKNRERAIGYWEKLGFNRQRAEEKAGPPRQ